MESPVADSPWSLLDGGTFWRSRTGHFMTGYFDHLHLLLVMGGKSSNADTAVCYNDIWSYNQVGSVGSWSEVVVDSEDLHWMPRAGFQDSIQDGKLYLSGGEDCNLGYHNDVWTTVNFRVWLEVTVEAPWSGRSAHGFEFLPISQKFWIFGGRQRAGGWEFCEDVWSSDDGSDWILEVPAAPFGRRAGFASVVLESAPDNIYIFGGEKQLTLLDTPTFLNGVVACGYRSVGRLSNKKFFIVRW